MKIKQSIYILLLVIPTTVFGQTDSITSHLTFEGDFRFRIEEDWNSRKSDGTFRDDRSRLRYRMRAGVHYTNQWYTTGLRIRTGNPRKQQDPQLTLGDGFKEFGTLPIGFEKIYFQGQWNTFKFWVGKNTFPFENNNELFWSDNVFPEGVSLYKGVKLNSTVLPYIDIRAGHFILSTAGQSFADDAFFQGYQMYLNFFEKSFELFPAFYLFKNIPNIPDGGGTFNLDYSIFHLGSRVNILKKPGLQLKLDFYHNFQNYLGNDSIPADFKDQKSGMTVGLKYGALAQKKT